MKQITAISLATTTLLAALQALSAPAQASFGDFLLGVGAAVGVGAIVDSSRQQQERYRPVPPQQEYYRGVEDGTNGAKYDNPRNSPDYDRGYQEGVRRRRGRR